MQQVDRPTQPVDTARTAEVGKLYSVTGESLSPDAYKKHVTETLPTSEDELLLRDIIKQKDWVTQMQMS
jgi:hypothetical protein